MKNGRKRTSTGGKGEERTAALAVTVRPVDAAPHVAGHAGWSLVDILGPVLDLTVALAQVRRLGRLGGRVLLADEPLEHDGENESGTHHRKNQDKRDVEDNLRGDAPNRIRIDRADLDQLFKALSRGLITGRLEGPSDIAASNSLVSGVDLSRSSLNLDGYVT